VAHVHDERHGEGGGVNERYGIWRGFRLRLLVLGGLAAILGLIDLAGHLVFGVDVLALGSRDSNLPTSEAFPIYVGVLALAVAIQAGCWAAARRFQQPMLINGSAADDQTFKSFELAASKRLSRRWSLLASYSATKIRIPNVQNTASTGNDFTNPGLQVFLATFDPNAEINTLMHVWEWQGRLDGAYIFPHDVLASANFEHRSGAPYARTVSFTGGQQIPSLVARVEPIGARRLPNINLLHMRLEKSLRVTKGQKVSLRLNVYNVTNINSEQSITQLSGANFGRPAGIVPPRILELGVNYTF